MLNIILQVCLGISAFWLLYHVAFKYKAAAATNRLFLMAGLLVPWLMPLITLPSTSLLAVEPILLPTVNLSQSLSGATLDNQTPFAWAWWLYLSGVAALLIYHGAGLWQLLKLLWAAQKHTSFKNVYLLPQEVMPFSFAGKIFIPQNLSDEQKQVVLAHEQWHINRYHSVDVLWALAVQTALWFLPVMPFYLRDLKTEHEFEVDKKMLGGHKLSGYAETLLQLSLVPVQNASFHSFSAPNLKNRILMMTQKPQNNWYKLLYMLPIIIGLLYLNACSETKSGQKELVEPKAISIIDADEPPQFANCAEGLTKQEQLNCFNQGMQLTVQQNFKYPKAAINENLEGKLYVGFTIDYNGEVTDLEMKRGAEGETTGAMALNEAALAVFQNLPKLKPASKDGQPISVSYVMPINLKL